MEERERKERLGGGGREMEEREKRGWGGGGGEESKGENFTIAKLLISLIPRAHSHTKL